MWFTTQSPLLIWAISSSAIQFPSPQTVTVMMNDVLCSNWSMAEHFPTGWTYQPGSEVWSSLSGRRVKTHCVRAITFLKDQCHSPGEIPGHVCNRHDDYSVQEFTPTAINVQAKLQLLPNINRIPAAWWIHSLAQLHSYATYLHYITLIHCHPKTCLY